MSRILPASIVADHTGIAYPKRLLNPSIVSSGDFKYQKIFGEDQFVASGVVYIPVKSSKPAKSSKDNSYVRPCPVKGVDC